MAYTSLESKHNEKTPFLRDNASIIVIHLFFLLFIIFLSLYIANFSSHMHHNFNTLFLFHLLIPRKEEKMSKISDCKATLVDECRGVLHVYSDGSIVRSSRSSFNVHVSDDGTVLWKDVVFDPAHDLQLRLYKPADSSCSKLPVFFYFHGGGFCIGSRTWPNCQNYCFRLTSQLRAVVVSPDYRLAPENRLPDAIEDGFVAVKWLQAQAVSNEPDPWLSDVADFSRVFISGDSAGGNMAHHLAARLGVGSPELAPVRVKGYVLLGPFFGGIIRTKSEAEGPKDAFLNLELIDRFWRLSIPVGDNTDHPIANPFGPMNKSLEAIDLDPILVVAGGSDLLRDRAEDYAMRLKKWGKDIEYVEFEGQQHGFFTIDPNSEPSNKLMLIIKQFIEKHSGKV
ncbi:probable carboxylesterase 15 [Abrus precatorius]|uniref:Probable carboxylesterase 15 n=1 Tax=Abrus precatorius TaxID=3816 RepID=A0A8B8KTY2_ABRPR|nr:probable carboxylesterase 15 [Abrus precatorius]